MLPILLLGPGTSLGAYGFTVMYRMTKDKQYRSRQKKIAAFMLNDKNMPVDLILTGIMMLPVFLHLQGCFCRGNHGLVLTGAGTVR